MCETVDLDFGLQRHNEMAWLAPQREGSIMAMAFLDLVVVLICPLIVSGAAWVIAVKAPAWTDEISEVVRALTQPNGDKKKTSRGVNFSPPQ
jgi:hypothetical protein